MHIYLDHNATAPLHPAAAAVWRAYSDRNLPENPSSIHWAGQAARRALSDAREKLAGLLGGRPRDLIFTASGTEANALALRGAIAAASGGRRRVLVSALEHVSVLKTLEALGNERPGLEVQRLAPDRHGVLDLAAAERALGGDVLLVSLMLANNEIGTLQPVRELALLARAYGVLVHCDAAQAVGKIPVNAAELGVDLLTAGGHKFGGGLGCGLLLARQGTPLMPLLSGHQELGRRGGTENVAAVSAAAAALAAVAPDLGRPLDPVAEQRDRLEQQLLASVPGAQVQGGGARRLPNTTTLTFEGADGEAVLIGLDIAGVAASSGAACASGTLEPSHVLLAMGLPPALARTAVRFSLGSTTSAAEIDRVLELLPDIVAAVRREAKAGRAASAGGLVST